MAGYGLVTLKELKPLPLKEVSVRGEIRGFVLGLQSRLRYENDSPTQPLEVVFRFPVEQSQAVVGLTATVDGRRVVARLKEKQAARADYDDALAGGRTAALGQETSSGDVFCVSLGNLPPLKEAEVVLELVGELPVDAEGGGGVRFSLPTTLKPRYVPAGEGDEDPLEKVGGAGSDDGGGVIQAKITSGLKSFELCVYDQEDISDVTSPTHQIAVAREAKKLVVTLSEQQPKMLSIDDDLVVLVKHKAPHSAKALMEGGRRDGSDFMKQAAVMINFFPDLPSGREREEEEEEEEASTKCEFIFLVDRSGSMAGKYISSARETLLLFLKSLPENCRFNIVGFGSSFVKLFNNDDCDRDSDRQRGGGGGVGSVPYTQEALDKATAHVREIQANLGGTELLAPLREVLGRRPDQDQGGLSRQVFVLTDGAVSNTKACVEVVRRNASHCRCFTFGIGSGASTALVEGLASAGNGSAEFIKTGERMQPKVIRSLKQACQPSVTGVSIKFEFNSSSSSSSSSSSNDDADDSNGGVLAYCCPKNVPPIFSGEKLVMYGLIKLPVAAAAAAADKTGDESPLPVLEGMATLEGEMLGKTFRHQVKFCIGHAPYDDEEEEEDGKKTSHLYPVHRLAAKALISDWVRDDGSGSWGGATTTKWASARDTIIGVSVEASVISPHTAFVAVDDDDDEAAPVQGSLQVWDLQAPPPSSIASISAQVNSVQMAMYQNIDMCLSKDQSLESLSSKSDALSSSANMFSKSARPVSKRSAAAGGFLSGLTSWVGGIFQRRQAPAKATMLDSSVDRSASMRDSSDDDSVEEECEETEKEGEVLSEDLCEDLPVVKSLCSRSLPVPATTAPPQPHGSADDDILSQLIAAQQADGSWKLDSPCLERALLKTKREIEDAFPQPAAAAVQSKVPRPLPPLLTSVWATVLVLTALEKRCKGQREEWELLARKAERWLRRQVLPEGVELSGLRECARNFVC